MMVSDRPCSFTRTTGTREEKIGQIIDMVLAQLKWRLLIKTKLGPAVANVQDMRGSNNAGQRSNGATRMLAQKRFGRSTPLML
jgi:hypothetical protein